MSKKKQADGSSEAELLEVSEKNRERLEKAKEEWSNYHFPKNPKGPDFAIPEGIFLPVALMRLGARLLYNSGERNWDQSGYFDQYKETVNIITEWILNKKLRCFAISEQRKKEETPEQYLRTPFDTAFLEGKFEKEIEKAGKSYWETYWVYVDPKQFQKLENSLKPSSQEKKKKASDAEIEKARAEIEAEHIKNGTFANRKILYDQLNAKLGKGSITRVQSDKALKRMSEKILRKLGERGKSNLLK